MQKISLYLICTAIALFLLHNSQSIQAKNQNSSELVNVKLFSKLNKIDSIEIKSPVVISPHHKTLNSQDNWKLVLNKNRLILQSKRNNINHFMPESFTLKPYQNKPICISSLDISKRCYRGEIDILHKDNSIRLINKVPFIDYLYSTVSSEIPRGWPAEAVKAQAIVAHTFLLNKLKERKIISDSTQDQFYGGIEYENPKYKTYVQEVKNIIITDKNKQTIEALYHSTCAGHTLNNEQVFGNKPLNYLRSVNCDYDKKSNFAKIKSYYISQERLKELLRTQTLIYKRDTAGQLVNINTDNTQYNKYQFWLKLGQTLGWQAVPSVKYDISCTNGICKLTSVGAGHAVGFCQWGAKGMAEEGFKYTAILNYYYKDINLSNLEK